MLALDHGEARCGCAITDPTGTLVRPLAAIEPDPQSVRELVAEHEAELVVVGLPFRSAARRVSRPAGARLRAELERALDVPVETYDERLTTKMAERSEREGARADRDSLAAAHLLESYLASSGRSADG